MRTDSSLMFVPYGTPLSLVAGAGVNIASTVIDLSGFGVGVVDNNIIGTATVFGTDLGIGKFKAQVEAVIGTALTTATVATLNTALQMAPDNGSGSPGTYQTIVETGPLTVAQLVADTVFARFDWPAAFPANLQPRFARLLFQVPAATNMTAGTCKFAIVTIDRDDQSNRYAAKNYVV